MDSLNHYLKQADGIVGERTIDQKKYDAEVIRWLCKGKSIAKAIKKANEKHPLEALQITDDTLADVQAHYEYLAGHEAILEKMTAIQK
jgi:hypothetical protein